MKNVKLSNNIKYQLEIKTLKNDIYNTPFDEIGDMGLLGRYLTISANLSTYFSELSNDEHFKIIQDIQFHRSLSNIDQYYHQLLLSNLKINDQSNVIEHSYTTGHIFVTYHTGSYRMFIQHLIKQNIPFCLVTEERYIKEQGATTQNIYKQISKNKHKELEILPAENPRLIFELTKRLRKGISVVFYIDGNTGATTKKLSENSNLLKINFLNHHIYARQGIAFLAYLSKSPMATVVAKRDKKLNNIIQLKSVETIELMQKYTRNDFINNITEKLYQELELFLKNNFEQWEGWFYVHKFFQQKITIGDLNIEEEGVSNKLTKFATITIDQFIHLIKYDEEHVFLVMKKDYQIMKITNLLYDVLSFFKVPKKIKSKKALIFNNQEISWKVVKELIKMNILKPI